MNFLMSLLEFLFHPLKPVFIKKWREGQYLEEGKKRGATHVLTIWDSSDMEIVGCKYVMPGQDSLAIQKCINIGTLSVGDVFEVKSV